MHVSSSDLARVLGITTRRVQQMVNEGIVSRDEKTGKYPLPKCVKSYIDYKCRENTPDDLDYERERTLHEKAKREKAELILAQMKGRLHDADIVEMVMTDMIVTAKTKLRGVPTRIAPLLLAQTELGIIENTMLTAIDECLTELADYEPELFADSDLFVADDNEEDDEYGEENQKVIQ